MALVEAGVIRTDMRKALPDRLHELHAGIREILADGRPAVVALEDLFAHPGFPRTAIIMGHVCGVVCLAAAQSGVPVEPIPPAAVKRAIVASGRAGKRQIQRMIRVLLGLAEEPGAHVGDALAVAITALSRRGGPTMQAVRLPAYLPALARGCPPGAPRQGMPARAGAARSGAGGQRPA